MIYKEDIVDAKERLDAWWDGEIIDRPVISYCIPKKRGKLGGYLDLMGEDWSLAQNHDEIEKAMDGFEERTELTIYGGETIPSYFPNYGPGIIAAIFGVIPKFENRTVWFNRPTKPEEILDLLESVKLNQNNEWYNRLVKVTEYAAKRAQNKYHVSLTDLGGVLDTLSSFLGPANIILTMKRQPSLIDICREIIFEKLISLYDKLQGIIEKYCDGCNTWLNVWCRRRYYPIQCDFSAMLNPKWFKRFALPDIIAQAEHMDYAIYHMDGVNQIPYLDDLLAIPQITGIQWVPGAGKPPMGSSEWMPLYKKIQSAGKNIVIDTFPEKVPFIYKSLNHNGLFTRTLYRSEIIANIFLPSFIGGKDGKIIFDAIEWAEKHDKKSLNKNDLDKYLTEKKIEANNKTKRDLLKEINSSMSEKKYFA
jgi:5-methyltetrahydrofolate--homocysteine methyltransferase